MYPIELKINRGLWRPFALRRLDEKFTRFSQRVLARDADTCQFCGFQAQHFQEVINLDMNYKNNRMNNLVTACCFCTQCFFLDYVGQSEYGGGLLIYAPEISQTDLNGLCHVLFCAIANATLYRADAQAIYNAFRLRARLIEDHYGEGMSDPRVFVHRVSDCLLDNKLEVGQQLLNGVRLLPSRTKFKVQIETWAAAAAEGIAD